MTTSGPPEFGAWRSRLWPIHAFELKKIVPMLFMFFFISFNYTILRDAKDTLVVGEMGAEAIPFIKFGGVIPGAIIFMLIYTKLSNILNRRALFYTTITPFLIFFGLYTLFLYPNRDALKLDAIGDSLKNFLPIGAAGFVESLRNWTASLFYILSELWGSVVLSLLFWGFANDITRVSEAKRFYALFGLGANLALMVSGPTIWYCAKELPRSCPAGVDPYQVTLNYLMGAAVVAGIAIISIYAWMNKAVLTDPRFYDPSEVKEKKEKPKLSVMESLVFLAKSRYILCIAALVVCYGLCINLVEVTWKGQLKLQYPEKTDYQAFMGIFSTVTGLTTIFMILVVASNAMRRGWGFAAILTPIVLIVTGIGFFAFVLFKDQLGGFVALTGSSPLWLAVIFGAAQNILSKASKYSLFDPTKETAYIPLDRESKVKGKAAIDVVGARLGKSGGSLIQMGLLLVFGSISAITPYIAVLLVGFIGLWILAVRSLNKQFTALTAEKAESTIS